MNIIPAMFLEVIRYIFILNILNLHDFFKIYIYFFYQFQGPILPCRLIGCENLVENVLDFWTLYLPLCLESAYELLGPHPFQKLDIVIVPRCYSGLGKNDALKK